MGACEGESAQPVTQPDPAVTPSAAVNDVPTARSDDEWAEIYLGWKDRIDVVLSPAESERMQAELRRIANEAVDVPLRANASLLLGSVHASRNEHARAEAFFRHAAELVPDDPGPQMALALALHRQAKYPEAAAVQLRVTELDPDNLENWLSLAEIRYRAGDQPGSLAAYVSYEQRRKGLIDGLTLPSRAGGYVVSETERVGCAQALASATDQGTAVALAYALRSDPSAVVRITVAEVMEIQRLGWYRPVLEGALAAEKDPATKEAIGAALAEVLRDPVDVREPPPMAASDPPKPEDPAIAPAG